ncbi:hypothetical protein GALMADRAFT_257897 [Galerina marginata CBS 339.88]|uniref:Uncharacterized protein n=1 Tax=Galerina marginata (strain CBS 339.88) TaxID=685588 RepID=A0A067SLK4_GALM3|nr:hypothetical protein GALMADRAFT_257897 [Galerina marginata CBS 339.88]
MLEIHFNDFKVSLSKLFSRDRESESDNLQVQNGEFYLAYYVDPKAKTTPLIRSDYLYGIIIRREGTEKDWKYLHQNLNSKSKPCAYMFLGKFNIPEPMDIREFEVGLSDAYEDKVAVECNQSTPATFSVFLITPIDDNAFLFSNYQALEVKGYSQSLPGSPDDIWNKGLDFLETPRVRIKEPKDKARDDIPVFDMNGRKYDPSASFAPSPSAGPDNQPDEQ